MSGKNILCILVLVQLHSINAVTLVYNLKVRQIFKVPALLNELLKSRELISIVPIFFARNSHIVSQSPAVVDVCEKRRVGGSLFNFRYLYSKNWWIEATTAVEHDYAQFTGSDSFTASRTGCDNFVFEGGYRYFWGDRVQLVGYGVVGLPARTKITRCDRYEPLVGTRFYTLGCGAEQSYSFISEMRRSLSFILQERFLHGFNRNWCPILPEGSKLQPGNVTDVLFTLQYRERTTIMQLAYNPTFFTNQALILPTQEIKSDSFVRHSGSLIISHGWFKGLFGKPFICGIGCNLSTSKKFDAKTATAWIYGTLVF